MSSAKLTGPQVKHCQRITIPSTIPPPPPSTSDKPITIDDIPVSTVTLKSDPPPSLLTRKCPARGKCSPFFNGVYGRLLFSLMPAYHYSAIPQGKSILFHYFRKAFPHEVVEGSSYILVDINDNLWVAPEVFLKWRQAIEAGNMKELDLNIYQLCILHIGTEYCLYYLLWKDSFKNVYHPAPPPYSPLSVGDDEEEEEAFLADEDEDDPDFLPNKK